MSIQSIVSSPKKMKLTAKQEAFALNLFKGLTQREAWIKAGYSNRYVVAWIDSHACNLAGQAKIQTRLAELRQKVEDAAISTEKERRKLLTQIQRATVADFVDEYGNLAITEKAQLNTPAVQEIKTERTLVGIRTTLKLRDPVGAIDIHNKMDRLYNDTPPNFNDNRVINFILSDEQGKQLIDGISKRLTDGNSNAGS